MAQVGRLGDLCYYNVVFDVNGSKFPNAKYHCSSKFMVAVFGQLCSMLLL